MPTGAMTPADLDRFVKGWARRTARVLDRVLNEQPSGLLAAFPVDASLESQMIEHFERYNNPGQIDQPLDGPGDTTKWNFKRSYKDLTNSWDKFTYFILDSAQTAAAVNRFAMDGTRDAARYFTATRVYKIIRELKAKAGDSTSASGTWGASGSGDAEQDIVTAIKSIVEATGIDPEQHNFGVVYPSKVLDEFKQLDLIHMVVQQLSEYLKAAWKINLYPFTPFRDAAGNRVIDVSGSTDSDILGTSALVFVEGEITMLVGEYRPGDIMLHEVTREHATGYITTFKQCVDALAIPTDGQANGKSDLIFEITGVIA